MKRWQVVEEVYDTNENLRMGSWKLGWSTHRGGITLKSFELRTTYLSTCLAGIRVRHRSFHFESKKEGTHRLSFSRLIAYQHWWHSSIADWVFMDSLKSIGSLGQTVIRSWESIMMIYYHIIIPLPSFPDLCSGCLELPPSLNCAKFPFKRSGRLHWAPQRS